MSSFEWNKIAGAILASMIVAMVSGIIAGNLVKPMPLSKPAYVVAGAEAPKGGEAAAAPAGPEPVEPLLATASADAGKNTAKVCAACHTFDKGGPARVGPNLYGIFGSPIAEARGGFQFSTALSAHDKDKWTVDNLNHWLANPQAFAKGTKMTFSGLPKAQDRANVIAYLNSLSDSPQKLGQ